MNNSLHYYYGLSYIGITQSMQHVIACYLNGMLYTSDNTFRIYKRYLVWDEGMKSQSAVVEWKIYWEELSHQ